MILTLLLIFSAFQTLALFLLAWKLFSADDSVSSIERLTSEMKDEFFRNREASGAQSKQDREEQTRALKLFNDSVIKHMTDISTLQKNQLDVFSQRLDTLTKRQDANMETMRGVVEKKLTQLQDDNSKKLEQMRATVDEKLHATLEKRLGESFKLVSERLDTVHKGLGEMQTLASGVGDLKRVLTNVKTRGTWGEIQLSNLLEQIFTPDQYESNVKIKPRSQDFVEFAVKLPGKDPHDEKVVWLPIDAKCPQDPYQRLCEAQDAADVAAVETEGKQLEMMIKREARSIKDKYIDPPQTTDFAIMFLPIEGMYAEVLRRPGLQDTLQRDYRVMVTGPSTLAALLNSLQLGFRTLAIEKRSSEVWSVLGKVKTEFQKFGTLIDKTKKKLQEATNTIEDVSSKSRNIERKLKQVEALPDAEVVLKVESHDDVQQQVLLS